MSCFYILILYIRSISALRRREGVYFLDHTDWVWFTCFLWSWICTLHGCPVTSRSFILFICLRIVASLLNEREVARISGVLVD
jgi:hypothetical protein